MLKGEYEYKYYVAERISNVYRFLKKNDKGFFDRERQRSRTTIVLQAAIGEKCFETIMILGRLYSTPSCFQPICMASSWPAARNRWNRSTS